MPLDSADAAEHNLLKALGIWAAAADEGQLDQRDGCTFVRCAVPLRAFNQVIVSRRPADVAAIMTWTSEYFREVGGRFRLRIRDDVEPVPDQPFIAGGLVRKDGIPCLSATISKPAAQSNIEIRPVVDELTLAHHIDVVASAFEWWRDDLVQVLRRSLLDVGSWHAYVGYLNGEAVTTTQMIVDGETAGLYYVGTVEGARGRGCGEAITRHAMGEAAALGCSRIALQASPMGLPTYERIGFKRVSYYRTFVAAGK